jgi:hypothetical protein
MLAAERIANEHAASPETFPTSRVADGGALPGNPVSRSVTTEQARKDEVKLSADDPMGTLLWDRKADARALAWDTCLFAKPFQSLFRFKYEVKV